MEKNQDRDYLSVGDYLLSGSIVRVFGDEENTTRLYILTDSFVAGKDDMVKMIPLDASNVQCFLSNKPVVPCSCCMGGGNKLEHLDNGKVRSVKEWLEEQECEVPVQCPSCEGKSYRKNSMYFANVEYVADNVEQLITDNLIKAITKA